MLRYYYPISNIHFEKQVDVDVEEICIDTAECESSNSIEKGLNLCAPESGGCNKVKLFSRGGGIKNVTYLKLIFDKYIEYTISIYDREI
jgi:hypothetical protein